MWQAIYPNSYLQPAREPGGNWFLQPGQTINANTWLLPFHGSDRKTAFTSAKVRSTKKFGYSYPDVKDWQFTGNGAAGRLSAAVTARVNSLYNLRGRSAKRSVRGTGLERRATPHEWSVEVSAPNAALGGASYSVSLFLGEKPADAAEWPVKAVGGLYVLAQPTSPLSGPMIAHTEVILTDFMSDNGIDTTNIDASRAYLDKNLTWGVQKVSNLSCDLTPSVTE